MQLTVKAKQAGKKYAIIEDKIIEIDNIGKTPLLQELLKAVVKQQVEEYNRKPVEKNLLPFLSKSKIEEKSETGKVGFESIYNKNKADITKAQETALQAFEDGMFSVFAGDFEVRSLKEEVKLTDSTVIIFIRLTFLAGSYW
jgi:hypothetical protein